ncbi:MAG: ribosome biogenesis GTPase Der [Actinobacteria bacterium HGW-Actinobacteria-9]|nr:MAG: ribosome biogenesis GTPase Der [Actinobacteria bacterium HGW-Actinobacteria-9]
MALPIVAVVGRPNVGKSTLVNRIAQTSDAIVHEQRGVTRDRSYHRADWNGRDFMLIDTGGIEHAKEDPFAESIRSQAMMAAEEADVIVVLVDGKSGVLDGDEQVARLLQRSGKPIFLAVNKMDTPNDDTASHEFWSLGLGQPWPVSATHGHGTGDLLDEIVKALPEPEEYVESDSIDIAIIGRPNAGKSSLLNRLVGRERAIVSDVAGTTRDSFDTAVERDGRTYRFIDTAGIRRKSQIDEDVEYYGFVRAMRAIDNAHIALLVIDSTIGITDGDQRIARFAEERGSGLIIVLNKWDLISDEEEREELIYQVQEQLGFVSYAPVLRISALTGAKVHRVYEMIDKAYTAYTSEITTSALNKLLTELRDFGHTVSKGRMTLRVHYVTQTHVKPPGFTFFANHPRLGDDNFKRYLENRMRAAFDLTGTPITIKFKQKD